MEKKSKDLPIHYIKNEEFKTVFATGAHGGITLNGLLNVNFYCDRTVIPRKSQLKVDDNGLISEVDTEGRDGGIREVQVGVLMDISTAKNIINWLDSHIKTLENAKPING